jgi:hypothetical protein
LKEQVDIDAPLDEVRFGTTPELIRYAMNPHFDDNIMSGEDEEGQPIFFDWLRDEDTAPVRVQVKEDYAKAKWAVAWTDEEAIARAFNKSKAEHVAAALQTPPLRGKDYRVYTLK